MGPNEQLNVWGIFCRIENGDVNIGDVNHDNTDEITFTDIYGLYLPSRPQEMATLPLCCNPRPGMGESLYLSLYKGKKMILRRNEVALALINNSIHISTEEEREQDAMHGEEHTTKLLLLDEPLAFYKSEKPQVRVRNANTATPTNETYSRVKISFLCEIVDKKATLAVMGLPAPAQA